MVRLYLGRATADDILAAATDADPKRAKEKRCAAAFYLGQRALLDGRGDEARRYFRAAVDGGARSCVEYGGAKAELARL